MHVVKHQIVQLKCILVHSLRFYVPWFAYLVMYAGFEAYLVGGCVRDLILKRIPKDFDVITTANLKQVW